MVNKIFEIPASPVVVDESIELFRFMARMEGTLTPDHIFLIWRWGVEMGPEVQACAKMVFLWDPRGNMGQTSKRQPGFSTRVGVNVLLFPQQQKLNAEQDASSS